MFRTLIVVATLVAGLSAFSRAAVEVNLSTPKDAARTFGQGMSEGDIDAVKAAAIADENQQRALEALVLVVSNFKKVEEAAVAKFGEAGKGVASQQQMSIGEELAQIDQATETIDGETAILATPDNEDPLHLRLVDGQWKVDFAAMPGTDQVEQAIPVINAMADAADQLAEEIDADKYKTAEEARTALGQKMMGAMMAAHVPSTLPADDETMDQPDDATLPDDSMDDAAEEPSADEQPAE